MIEVENGKNVPRDRGKWRYVVITAMDHNIVNGI